MTHSIPDASLAQHIAILGKTGSGKTSTAKLAVEQVVAAGARVCVLDPIKSDWWGLTSSADGQHPGLPFYILGGPHGHVPLHASAGAAIGELVATGQLPLSIIDMADFEPGGHQQFFTAFASALLRKMRGVVYLIIEEAHEFAPKERAGFNAENMAIHFAKKLATAGRSKGIRLIVATQRVQALHNAVLGSCDSVIAHRLTAPADQEPVKKWLKANTEKAIAEQVAASLASLKTGTGWLCSGEAKVFELVHFPRIATYDNSATPTGDCADHHVATAPVDREKLKAIIGNAVQQAEANDPEALKAEIAKLKAERAKPPATSQVINQEALAEARRDGETRGYSRGKIEGYREGIRDLSATYGALMKSVAGAKQAIDDIERAGASMQTWLDKLDERETEISKEAAPARSSYASLPSSQTLTEPKHSNGGQPSIRDGAGNITNALQRVLDAIAFWRALGFNQVERRRACVTAGLSPKASTFSVYIAQLAQLGMVETAPGTVRLTEAGICQANHPDRRPTRAHIKSQALTLLTAAEARVFEAVHAAYPDTISRADLADRLGLSKTASTLSVYISAVSGFGLVKNAGRGEVRAADWLFP